MTFSSIFKLIIVGGNIVKYWPVVNSARLTSTHVDSLTNHLLVDPNGVLES